MYRLKKYLRKNTQLKK